MKKAIKRSLKHIALDRDHDDRDFAKAVVEYADELSQAATEKLAGQLTPAHGAKAGGSVAIYGQAGAAIATVLHDAKRCGVDPRNTWGMFKAVGDEIAADVLPPPKD